jgi:hypothetical protein
VFTQEELKEAARKENVDLPVLLPLPDEEVTSSFRLDLDLSKFTTASFIVSFSHQIANVHKHSHIAGGRYSVQQLRPFS